MEVLAKKSRILWNNFTQFLSYDYDNEDDEYDKDDDED